MRCFRLYGLSIVAGLTLGLVALPASADVELAPVAVIDFSALGFAGNGFDPEPAAGELDSDDWSALLNDFTICDFGASCGGPGSDFSRGLGPGSNDIQGVWAYDVDGAGLIALGVQPVENLFNPGEFRLRLVNNTGADVSEFQVEYTVWINNDQDLASDLGLRHSVDNVVWADVDDALVSPAVADGNGFTPTDVVLTVTPEVPIADGTQYYLAWRGVDDIRPGDGTARDEFAIEGIALRLFDLCGNGITEGTEECDNGLDNIDTADCTSVCTIAVCGDGFTHEGVETCDDGNTDPGDACPADCGVESEGTSSGTGGGTGDSSGGGSGSEGADTSAGGSASASGASDSASATGASATGASAGSEDSGGESGGEDDGTAGCICNSSGDAAPIWSVFGFLGLGLLRRRRR